MRVLALITEPPFPPLSGTRVRNYHLWPALARQAIEVKVLGINSTGQPFEFPEAWNSLEAHFFRPKREPLPLRAYKGLSRSYHQFPTVPSLAQAVDQIVASWRPNVIHAEELKLGYYLPRFRGQNAVGVQSVSLHNVESLLFPQIASPAVSFGKEALKRIQAQSLRRFERRVIEAADIRFAYSEADMAIYEGLYPGVPFAATRNGANALALVPTKPTHPHSILMVAAWSYEPNRSGLHWFLNEVWPALSNRAGLTLTLTIAGSGLDAALKTRLGAAGALVVDTPLDLNPLYEANALVVVPLFKGSGTRGKILEALAHERMVVTTSKGPEGLELTEGEGFLLADDAPTMARRIMDALDDDAKREACAKLGREAVLMRYDWSVVANELIKKWERCVSP